MPAQVTLVLNATANSNATSAVTSSTDIAGRLTIAASDRDLTVGSTAVQIVPVCGDAVCSPGEPSIKGQNTTATTCMQDCPVQVGECDAPPDSGVGDSTKQCGGNGVCNPANLQCECFTGYAVRSPCICLNMCGWQPTVECLIQVIVTKLGSSCLHKTESRVLTALSDKTVIQTYHLLISALHHFVRHVCRAAPAATAVMAMAVQHGLGSRTRSASELSACSWTIQTQCFRAHLRRLLCRHHHLRCVHFCRAMSTAGARRLAIVFASVFS